MRYLKDIRFTLIFIAVFSFMLAIFTHFYLGIISGFQLISIPFDFFGRGLRLLSLSSEWGNVVAFIIYVGFALIPFLFLINKTKKGQKKGLTILLMVISIYSLFLIYFFINPGTMIGKLFPHYGYLTVEMGIKVIIASLYWGLWFSYFLLTLSESVLAPESYHKSAPMIRHLQNLFKFGACFYTISYCCILIFPLLNRITYVSTAEIITNVLSYVIDGIPVAFTVCILVKGVSLLEAMEKSHLKEEEHLAAIALGKVSKIGLYTIVICGIASNLLKLIMSGYLLDLNISIYLPLFPLITAFVSMILSGYFKEAGELKADDELFI